LHFELIVKISVLDITKLRSETSAGIMDCKKALTEARGDMEKAKAILKAKGLATAAKKAAKKTSAGRVEAYTHLDGKVGSLVKLTCETDFVARNSEFKKLAHELCLQVAAMKPKDAAALLKQEYIRDPSKTVEELVKETIAKVGENIRIEGFERMEV
jgi:elongation factor Ts